MSLYILSWILAAAINLGLGLFVYARNPRSEVNRTFMFAVLCIAFWAVDLFGLAVAEDAPAGSYSILYRDSNSAAVLPGSLRITAPAGRQ